MAKPKSADYHPPGWHITWFDQVRLDPERAKRFHEYRQALCDRLSNKAGRCDDERTEVNALWMRALDLLLAEGEAAIEAVVEEKKEETQ